VAARRVPFAKAHALGNDFVLVKEADVAGTSLGALARTLCDRHTGIGSDGLVVLKPSATPLAAFRIYNADGSEAGISGNALRCAAAWLLSGEKIPSSPSITLQTPVGTRHLVFLRREGEAWVFRAEMGKPSFAAADVPFRPPRPAPEPIIRFPLPVVDTTIPATILSMGNPQCILFIEETAAWDWRVLGAELEQHPYFPDRANVGFARVVETGRIEARFWERGAGHTLASGTGCCAAVVAAHLAGKVGRRVRVAVERGEVEVCWRDDDVLELTGPAEIVAEGTVRLPNGIEGSG
jgi:diaminopimelate epimerase